MESKIRFLIFLFCFLSASQLLGQKKMITYSSGGGTVDPNNKNVTILFKPVTASHEDMTLFADSALFNSSENSFTAYWNVKIIVNDSITIYGEKLFYDGNTRIVSMREKVRLIDGEMILTTEELTYDRNTNIAHYPNKGTTTKNQNTLKSIKGYYHSNTKDFFFRDSVVLTDQSSVIYSDTMLYNTETEIAYFEGPTHVYSDSSYIYCEAGWYNTITEESETNKNSYLQNKNQNVKSDTIYYNRITDFGTARWNVIMTDSTNNIILTGEYAEMNNKEHFSFLTDKATAMFIDDKLDTLFLHADTLYAHTDSLQDFESLRAYYKVKFYRNDIQGCCDSLYHFIPDSLTQMFYNPIIWMDERQFIGDTMEFTSGNDGLKIFEIKNNAFIISKEDYEEYDQVKGLNIKGYFENGELDYVDVTGNSESVYYIREEEKNELKPLIGVNAGKGERMRIYFENREPVKILTFEDPVMKIYPPREVPQEFKYMEGFKWLYEIRPKSKEDIYDKCICIEKELIEPIVENIAVSNKELDNQTEENKEIIEEIEETFENDETEEFELEDAMETANEIIEESNL